MTKSNREEKITGQTFQWIQKWKKSAGTLDPLSQFTKKHENQGEYFFYDFLYVPFLQNIILRHFPISTEKQFNWKLLQKNKTKIKN